MTNFKLCIFCVCAQLFSGVQLCVTPWTVARQAPLSMGFSRQEYWCGLPFPLPGDFPDPGGRAHVSCLGSRVLLLLGHLVTLCIFHHSWGKNKERGVVMNKNKVSIYAPEDCFPPANGPPSVTFPQILSEARAKGVGVPCPGGAASPGTRALLAAGGCVYTTGCWATITSTDQLQGSLPMPSCGNQRCLQTLPMSLGDKLSLSWNPG